MKNLILMTAIALMCYAIVNSQEISNTILGTIEDTTIYWELSPDSIMKISGHDDIPKNMANRK